MNLSKDRPIDYLPVLIAKGIPLAKDPKHRKDRVIGINWAKVKDYEDKDLIMAGEIGRTGEG